MGPRFRTVTVKQLPEMQSHEMVSAFRRGFDECLRLDRPRIVLNCSDLPALGRSDLHLLLCCLEEAMKRNGDVRLSSVPELALAALEATGIDRLFQIYDNDADAVMSFQCIPVSAMPETNSNRRPAGFEESDAADDLFRSAGDAVYCDVVQTLSGS